MNPQRIFKLISIQREISLAVSYRLLCMSYANVVNIAVGIRFRLPRLLLLCLLLLHSQFLGLSRKLLILIDVLLFFPSPAATSNDSGRPVVVVEMLLLLSILLAVVVVVVMGIFVRRGKATVCGCVCPAAQ